MPGRLEIIGFYRLIKYKEAGTPPPPDSDHWFSYPISLKKSGLLAQLLRGCEALGTT